MYALNNIYSGIEMINLMSNQIYDFAKRLLINLVLRKLSSNEKKINLVLVILKTISTNNFCFFFLLFLSWTNFIILSRHWNQMYVVSSFKWPNQLRHQWFTWQGLKEGKFCTCAAYETLKIYYRCVAY